MEGDIVQCIYDVARHREREWHGRRRALLDPVLRRFSKLVTISIIVVGITGVFAAQLRLPGLDALFTAGSGWLVVTKIVLLLALAVLGNGARVRLAANRIPVLRWAVLEV